MIVLAGRPTSTRQRGMVLVTSLLLLVVVTLLAVSMFRSFGLDEKIAGNLREKQRAQTPLDLFRETQLSRYNPVSGDIRAGMRRRFSGSLAALRGTSGLPHALITLTAASCFGILRTSIRC